MVSYRCMTASVRDAICTGTSQRTDHAKTAYFSLMFLSHPSDRTPSLVRSSSESLSGSSGVDCCQQGKGASHSWQQAIYFVEDHTKLRGAEGVQERADRRFCVDLEDRHDVAVQDRVAIPSRSIALRSETTVLVFRAGLDHFAILSIPRRNPGDEISLSVREAGH